MQPAAIVTACLIVASLALRLALACGPIENLDGYCLPDDTYLFLDLARNIGRGDGPLYGDAFTNGFQPLFAFLLAPLFWIYDGGDAPLRVALVGLCIIDTLTLIAIAWLARVICKGSWLAAAMIAAGWIANHQGLRNCLNGMETALALACLVMAFAAHRRVYSSTRIELTTIRALLTGATIGIAMLARIDLALFGLASTLVIAARCALGRTAIVRPWTTAGGYAAGALLAFLPWMIYSYWYTGDLYPISGEAVRFQANMHYEVFAFAEDPNWIHLRRAAGEIVRGNLVWLAFGSVAGIALVFRRAARIEALPRCTTLWPLLVYAIALFLAYALYVRGTWFFHRYLYPISLPIMLFGAVLLDTHLRSLPRRARTVLAVLVLLGLVLGSRYATRGYALITGVDRWSSEWIPGGTRTGWFGYRGLGLWAADRFEPGTILGAKQSGAIGYYADHCTVLNLDGVVNGSALYALKRRRAIPYIVDSEIEYVILWDLGEAFLRHLSPESSHDRLRRVESVPDIHSWGDPGTNQWHVYRVE